MRWLDIDLGPSVIAANQSALFGSLDSGGLDEVPFTIVRSRMILTIWSDQTAAAERQEGRFGAIVVKNTAVLIGATAVPDPFVEVDDDWYVYQAFQTQVMTRVENAAGVFREVSQTQYDIDSKAMRKVDSGEDLAFMLRNSNATFGLTAAIAGRFLVKLH